MGYCITNLINEKKYVGKTTYSITKRFQEHCKDSKKERCERRPLYNAMNKYGIENFVVEELIECPNDELDSYEKMYIEKPMGIMLLKVALYYSIMIKLLKPMHQGVL